MHLRHIILLSFFLYFKNEVNSEHLYHDDLVTIEIQNGLIQGRKYINDNSKVYYGFQGIPYAQPPIGNLRLESPQKAEPWEGVLDATKDSKTCVGSNYLQYPDLQSEDCLYINVYVPTLNSTEKLAVMVWIYGGAFTDGSSLKTIYGPDFLLAQNVIVVSFNYRLGPLGFISTADDILPGNLGLKDQTLALKWTKDNIIYFGGDADKITIFGQSAGATSVGLHLISNRSSGLFRAAILESGSATVHWSVDWAPNEVANQIADAIPGNVIDFRNDSKSLKDFLKGVSLESIVTGFVALPSGIHPSPTIEVEHEDAFITQSHYELLSNGSFEKVPLLIGVCSEESLMGLQNLDNAKLVAQSYDLNSHILVTEDIRPESENLDLVTQAIKDIYLTEGKTFSEDLVALAEYFTDNRYAKGVIKHAELASEFVPVYLYEFAYYGGRVITPAYIEGAERAGHAAELPYLFNMTKALGMNSEEEADLLTQNRMVTLWTNFAKYLDPTPEQNDLFQNIRWPLTSRENLRYLSLNDTLKVRDHIKANAYTKWNDVYENYAAKPFITF